MLSLILVKLYVVGLMGIGLFAWATRVCAGDFDVATATNGVGLDLFRKLEGGAQPGNLAISPYSIESAMALAYAGADGETRTEMARVLGFPEDDNLLQAALSSLRDSLNKIASDSAALKKQMEMYGVLDVSAVEWHAANRLFGQQGYGFRSTFLETLKGGYGTPFEDADFRNHPDAERRRINAWVEDQTKNKIRDLIPEPGVNAGTRLVLVNALYLKAPWEHLFTKSETSDMSFYPVDAKPEAVPTMREKEHLGYLKGSGYTAVAIPYQGGGLQFLILLPDDKKGLGHMIAGITPALLKACANIRYSSAVSLYLPRFRLEGASINLTESLESLGMKSAFDRPRGSADFDRAAPRTPEDYLGISEVYHKAFVAVDESGTEATAATAIAMAAFGVELNPPKPIEVHVDHPFFFAIQHRVSGVCLFLGSVGDPK